MKTNATQIIILGIFILFLVAGVIVFAKFSSGPSSTADSTQITIWGTAPEFAMSSVLETVNNNKIAVLNVTYKEIPPETFEQTLIEALADGYGPDAVLLPNTLLLKNQRKFTLIGNNALSARTFRDTFVEGAEPLMTSTGTYGLPVAVDPLVMYWNRNILTSKNVARPPQTWEEVLALADILTERRNDRSIIKSTVALGDYRNVKYSKDILLALTMQAGGSFVGRDDNDRPINLLGNDTINSLNPFTASLSFFTQFSDPLKSVYSWNRSLPDSETAFINGDLAFYFGHASDAAEIRSKNPNLNFDIAPLPQPKDAPVKFTSGVMYSFSILSSSKNQQAAFNNISILTSGTVASLVSGAIGLPPARRDLLSSLPGTSFGDVFWRSALWTKTWLDPDPIKTAAIFAQGIDDVVTGKSKPVDAAKLIGQQINELLR